MRKNDSKDSINRYNKIIEVINDKAKEYIISVSYTHLTLPTSDLV